MVVSVARVPRPAATSGVTPVSTSVTPRGTAISRSRAKINATELSSPTTSWKSSNRWVRRSGPASSARTRSSTLLAVPKNRKPCRCSTMRSLPVARSAARSSSGRARSLSAALPS